MYSNHRVCRWLRSRMENTVCKLPLESATEVLIFGKFRSAVSRSQACTLPSICVVFGQDSKFFRRETLYSAGESLDLARELLVNPGPHMRI